MFYDVLIKIKSCLEFLAISVRLNINIILKILDVFILDVFE